MTSAAAIGTPMGGSQPIQVALPHPDDNRKRLRPKSVTWASEDKLNQVRLFAAEDAPSVSGLVMQDLLEAKKTKFMHALVPVFVDDLPPGFGGVVTKRAKLDSAAILAMVAQIAWKVPEKFSHDPLWQVAMGDESSEAMVQRERELKILEAVYPRPSAVPSSSLEPSETPTVYEECRVLEIPLIPMEDEDDGPEENDLLGDTEDSNSAIFSSNGSLSGKDTSTYPPGYSPAKDVPSLKSQLKGGSSSAVAQLNSDVASNFLKNADPDVAAAAAAAYAVVKAKESGALIDHELLIKILSNPLLIETLTASNPSLRKQLGDDRGSENGNGLKTRNDKVREGSLAGAANHMNPFHVQGRLRYDAPGVTVVPPWGSNASGLPVAQGRGHHMGGAHEMLGHGRGAFGNIGPPGRQYAMPRPDSRELIHQHGMPGMIMNDAQLRQSAAPVPFDEVMFGHDSERFRVGQPWSGINPSAPPFLGMGRSSAAPQDRPGGPKIRKQCYFYNTPRGCRNGIYCNFLHETAPDKHVGEKIVTNDAGQERKSPVGGDSNSDGEAK